MQIVFATYPWAYFTPGGGEIQIEKLYKYIKNRGIDIYKFDSWNPFYEAKLYHFFSCMGVSIDFCNYLKSIDKKLVLSTSLWVTKDTMENYNIQSIKLQMLVADRIIVNSDIDKNLLSNIFNIEKEKFSVVHNGFEPELLSLREKAFKRSKGIPNTWDEYIFCLANIERRKNQHLLIEACKLSNKKLVLAGYIRDQDYFNSLDIDNNDLVTFLGPVENHSYEFFSLYLNSSCFILPSTLETPGLAALEAAALGIPIIVTSEGSSKEYFGDIKTYYDGKKGNVIELAELINNLFVSPLIGKVKFNQIKKFTRDNCINKQIDIYKELL